MLVAEKADEPTTGGSGSKAPGAGPSSCRRTRSSPSVSDPRIRINPELIDEIERFAEEKRRLTMRETVAADETSWRNSIRDQLEEELGRRVREVLQTPVPDSGNSGQRPSRQQSPPPDSDLESLERLNSHINFQDLMSKDAGDVTQSRKWKLLQAKRTFRSLMSNPGLPDCTDGGRPFLDQLRRDNDEEFNSRLLGGGYADGGAAYRQRLAAGGRPVEFYADLTDKANSNYGSFTVVEKYEFFHMFTKNGFRKAFRSGKLPDGSEVEFLANGKCRDKYGITRDEHGPFWPADFGPLFPAPEHKADAHPKVEPLVTEGHDARYPTVDTQKTSYEGRWRGVQIVYDTEMSSRDQTPRHVHDSQAPSLVFESRFESGNLRQARRVGQFEYELVLRTDLYTSRHTQWYYFRVQNAVPGATYRFKIINLHKRSSLYNYGMKPLLYSEKSVQMKKPGWRRAGHHITYAKNTGYIHCPLLQKDRTYHTLDWQMEFPHANDTCYLAHCYPYTFTDLREDLDTLLADPNRSKVMKREVLCETRAGNSCFLVTVTNFEHPESSGRRRRAIVVTGRVHPGEANSSWMMKGLLDYLTGPSATARQLRDKFIFKIVPMLNPDGVIVGNYRCSLAARDLNRNYRHPRKETFPTVWHTKAMMEDLSRWHNVLLYCDMHGHSRKQNVFMYGCNTEAFPAHDLSASEKFLKERLFPWMMSQKAPDKFWFRGCKFHVRKCKESTGRVVMFQQMQISNSFTMEATFCGSTICRGEKRHFSAADYQEMGRIFCEALLEYNVVQEDQTRKSEVVLEMTRAVTQQVLESRGLLPPDLPDFTTELGRHQLQSYCINDKAPNPEVAAAFLTMINQEQVGDRRASDKPASTNGDTDGQQAKGLMNIQHILNSMSSHTIDGCVQLLEQLELDNTSVESDSSDSDSESEPEMTFSEEAKTKRRRKRQRRRERRGDGVLQRHSADKQKVVDGGAHPGTVEPPKPGGPGLPVLSDSEIKKKKQEGLGMSKYVKKFVRTNPGFVNKYRDRSNGGIPCFAEERLLERSSKRMEESRQRQELEHQRLEMMALSGMGEGGDPGSTTPPLGTLPGQPLSTPQGLRRQVTNAELRQHFCAALGQFTFPPRTGYTHVGMQRGSTGHDGLGRLNGLALQPPEYDSSESDEDDEAPLPLPRGRSSSHPTDHPGMPQVLPHRRLGRICAPLPPVGSCSIPPRHSHSLAVAPLAIGGPGDYPRITGAPLTARHLASKAEVQSALVLRASRRVSERHAT